MARTGEEIGGMVVKSTEDGAQVTMRYSDEFPMEKFNVKVPIPKYTDEQYNQHMKSDAWTKEETDYLIQLCRDYDLRWFVIADRWNFNPEKDMKAAEEIAIHDDEMAPESTTSSTEPKKPRWPQSRSIEQLKSRYYAVAAAMLAINRPPSDMLPSEYALWEKMQKFDSNTEAQRKKLAEALFSRSEDEAMEERLLLAELKRIVDNEDLFLAERKDIYARLESVPSHRREGDQTHSSSAHLSALLQNLLAKEKRGKAIRPSETIPTTGGPAAAPAEPQRTQSWEKGSHPNQYTRRNTATEDGDHPPQKKGQAATNVRKLTQAEEAKFGVTHHDRLTSGVSFRHEKVIKLTQAKSQAQTLKLQSALTELQIPPRLVMPTEKVCREFERLIASVNLLLDVRKLHEKTKSEVEVLEEARRIRLGIPKDAAENGDAMDVDQNDNRGGKDTTEHNSTESKEVQPKTNGDVAQSEKRGPDSKPELTADEQKNKDTAEDEDETAELDEVEESKVDLDSEDENESESEHDAAEGQDEGEQEDDEGENDDEEQEDDDEEGEEADADVDVDVDEEAGDDDDDEPEIKLNLGEDNDDDEEEDGDGDAAADEDDAEAEEDEEEDGADEDSDNEEADDQDGEDSGGEQIGESEAEDDDGDQGEASGPPSIATRSHKRSASVLSEGSRAGSNRSGTGRKRSRK